MKNTYKIILVAVMIVLFTSCKNKWGWQPISSDHESTLNIYALLFVGDNISENSYYINVHQSLNLQQDIDVHVGNDTTWYGLNSLYDYYITAITKSAYIVEDAKVQIIDGVDTTNFYFTPPHYLEEYGRITHAAYWDTTRQFKPQPNREYTLKISTPDGQSVVGTIKTPNIPNIIDEQVADTLFNNRTFTITFNKVADDQHLRIKMRPAEEYTWL